MHFVAEKVRENALVLFFIHILKMVQVYIAIIIKKDARGYVKGVPFVNRRYLKGVPFLSKL